MKLIYVEISIYSYNKYAQIGMNLIGEVLDLMVPMTLFCIHNHQEFQNTFPIYFAFVNGG